MNCAISRALLERLIREAEAAHPEEICGLLLGRPGSIDALVPLRNAHPYAGRAFALDPAEHVAAARRAREAGEAVLGHYHSHPGGEVAPSAADAAEAQEQGVYWLIAAAGEARLWISRRDGPIQQAFEPARLVPR